MDTPKLIPAAVAVATLSATTPYAEQLAQGACDEGATIERACLVTADAPVDFHREVELSDGPALAPSAALGRTLITMPTHVNVHVITSA